MSLSVQECDYGTEVIGAYSSKETAEKVAKEHCGFSEEVELEKTKIIKL